MVVDATNAGKTLLRDLAAAREDALWAALRAVAEEADLAQRLARSDGVNEDTAVFLCELGDRAALQARQLRPILAATSDLIEPSDTMPE